MTRQIDATEDQIHVTVAQWLDLTYPQDQVKVHGVCWTSIEHRNARDKIEGAKRKARGVKAGFPDILLCYIGDVYVLELKTRTGRMSEDQGEMRDNLLAAGACWALCRSLDQVTDQLAAWEFPRTGRRVT